MVGPARARRAAAEHVRARLHRALDRTPAGWSEPLAAHDGSGERSDDPSGGTVAEGVPWVPPVLRGGRVAVDVRALTVMGLLAAAAVVFAAWSAWQATAVDAPAAPVLGASGEPVTGAQARGSPSAAASSPTPGPLLVVDVAGRVRRPGLARLPPGSRVADAIAAAGGLLPGVDVSGINLAAPLSDGQQVLVGVPGPGAPVGAGPTSPAGVGGVLDLNTATAEQLDALPGVGPVLAQRIVDWRTAHGRFGSVDQLGEVGGIGAKKLADITPRVRV